jgi:hypothetical protein
LEELLKKSPIKNFGIKVLHYERAKKQEEDKSVYLYEQQVKDTRMTFIKYCVLLYKEKVEPMVKLLKRKD